MKQKPYRLGYTTGVFDLFHVGHLNILKQAKEQCEFLIVGVSTDELVQTYKHKIPVIPFENRLEIVESIKFVDQVVPQISRDKFTAWEQYHFDVMFVGDDWKGSPLFKSVEMELNQVGAKIVFFPYTKGVSSTLLKEKVKVLANG